MNNFLCCMITSIDGLAPSVVTPMLTPVPLLIETTVFYKCCISIALVLYLYDMILNIEFTLAIQNFVSVVIHDPVFTLPAWNPWLCIRTIIHIVIAEIYIYCQSYGFIDTQRGLIFCIKRSPRFHRKTHFLLSPWVYPTPSISATLPCDGMPWL